MNTLMRNSTLALSPRRRFGHYESIDQSPSSWGKEAHAPKPSSKSRREPRHIMTTFSRRERAKRRQIYLHTYKMSSAKTHVECSSRVLKKGWVKAKSAVVKLLAIVRMDSLRKCGMNMRNPSVYCSSPLSVRSIPRFIPSRV